MKRLRLVSITVKVECRDHAVGASFLLKRQFMPCCSTQCQWLFVVHPTLARHVYEDLNGKIAEYCCMVVMMALWG